MKLLALDISTKTGYAVYNEGNLEQSGTLWPERQLSDIVSPYPFNFLTLCIHVTSLIVKKIEEIQPDTIAVEETTASQNNLSQKQLEYIHCMVLMYLLNHIVNSAQIKVVYIRDGVWKRMTGSNQNDEERRWNAKVRSLKKKAGKGKRVKIDGEYAYPKDKKDYYIRSANDHFGKNLNRKDENEAAALLIGLAYLRGAPHCDGTMFGGLLPKEEKKPSVV